MTGLGRKTFVAGEVLQAADVNGYLMDQSVMYFAGTAARASAIPSPTAGMMTFIAASSAVNVYDGSAWVEIAGGGGVTVGTAAPAGPADGDLWWDSDDGKLFLYYDDGSSQQWVDAAGPSVAVQATAPTGYEGQLWLDSTDGSMYTYYTDPGGTASSWIGAVSRSGGILQVVSTTKTDTFTMSSTTFADITGLSASITPRSTSSKIMVLATVSSGSQSGTVSTAMRLVRDATPIALGDAAGSRTRVSSDGMSDNGSAQQTILASNFLDSPSTTSSVTYKVQLRANTANTIAVNRSVTDSDNAAYARSVSTITLMEIAG